jgi:hypothetical protein
VGATAFRAKKASRGQCKARRAARLAGKPPKGRGHESAPWYVFGSSRDELERKIAKASGLRQPLN